MVKALLPSKVNDSCTPIEMVKPVLKIMRRLLETDGELVADRSTPPAFQTYLRLIAGIYMLKISSVKNYLPLIESVDINRLALLIQDSLYHVRKQFAEKLSSLIQLKKVPAYFSIMLMLAAHEPELELRNKVKNFLIRRTKQQRDANEALLEHSFARFAHIVVHHPDFSPDSEDLKLVEAYFIISNVFK